MPKTWIFQGNPDRFNVDRYISNHDDIYWSVKHEKHRSEMEIGDVVYIWRSTGSTDSVQGIIAKGVINEECKSKKDVNNPELLSEHYGLRLIRKHLIQKLVCL